MVSIDDIRIAISRADGIQFKVDGFFLPCRLYSDEQGFRGLICWEGRPLVWRTEDGIAFVYGHSVGDEIAMQVISLTPEDSEG